MIGPLTAAVVVVSEGADVDVAPKIDADHEIGALAKPTAPYKAARFYWTGDSDTSPDNACHLAIQTDKGWSVADLDVNCWQNGRYYRHVDIQELVVQAQLLWLRYRASSSDPDEGRMDFMEYLVVCGVADGAARCTKPIQLTLEADASVKWRVKASLSKGSLVLGLDKGKKAALPDGTKALLGKSTLRVE